MAKAAHKLLVKLTPVWEHHQDVWQHVCLRMNEKGEENIPYLEDFHFHPRKRNITQR